MTSELHVVFGAGQVGFPLAERLVVAGKRVRVAKRSSGHLPAGCEVALGDAADSNFCTEAARGASVVYHCMNPPYDTRIWAEMLYQWEEPFVIDDRRFRERFHLAPTDVDQAAIDTVEWAKRHYGRGTALS